MRISRKLKAFLDALDDFHQEMGYPPSYQEIADRLGVTSKSTVAHHVSSLRELGFESIAEYCERKHVPEQKGNALPVLGRVAAGAPIEAELNEEWLDVPSTYLKPGAEHFCLEVKGDSMIEDAILDGDHVVIRKQRTAANGQIVVARVENEATLKRIYKTKNKVELRPANPKYDSITVRAAQNFKIEGLLVGVLRQLA